MVDEFSGYAEQRELFRRAIAAGWNGKEPSVLGTFSANKELRSAMRFLEANAASEEPAPVARHKEIA